MKKKKVFKNEREAVERLVKEMIVGACRDNTSYQTEKELVAFACQRKIDHCCKQDPDAYTSPKCPTCPCNISNMNIECDGKCTWVENEAKDWMYRWDELKGMVM